MRKLLLIAAFASLSACATTSQVSPGDQMAANRARTPAQLVADREDLGAKVVYLCGDPVLDDQATSGGESLTHGGPCWQPQWAREEALLTRKSSAVEIQREVAALPPAVVPALTPAQLMALPQARLIPPPLMAMR